jgi:hypothetical protein
MLILASGDWSSDVCSSDLTPKKWRRLGDSLLAVATVIAIGGIWQFDSLKDIFTTNELRLMITSSIVLGVVGKFLTNFFKDEEI